ncbi:MAG: hypothetical protein CL822_01970 [Crocinitomicaceae bacterium]|nr:hypothetical protein [Crocinitomicaceae bacterium]
MADIIILSTADWDHPLWTNKQHTALALAASGHQVLYVESLGLRAPRAGRRDLKRIARRLLRMLRLPRLVAPRVWVWSPPVWPGGQTGWPLELNRHLLRRGLQLMAWWLDFKHWIFWTYNPLTALYLDLRGQQACVYHCVDRIQDQPGMPSDRLDVWEQRLSRAAQVVFTTSPELQASHRRWNYHTYFHGNVADFRHFNRALQQPAPSCPEALAACQRPRLLFTGAIDAYKLDLPLLLALAIQRPDWSFILVGPIGEADPSTEVADLKACSNVYFFGSQPYGDLPAWASHADVALLPLQLNGYTRHMFPMKFFEYLAAGLPVVATAIPALQEHADVATLCTPDASSFAAAIDQVLQGQGPSRPQRLQRAKGQTYENRTRSMLDLLERLGVMAEAEQRNPQRSRLHRSRLDCAVAWAMSPLERILGWMTDVLRLVGSASTSRAILLRLHQWGWLSPELQSRLVFELVQEGVHKEALVVLEQLWCVHGRVDAIKRLLFRRGSRPKDRRSALRMFEVFSGSTVLPNHFTRYCLIVFAHRCVDLADVPRMTQARQSLSGLAAGLAADPDTFVCLRENLRNRLKLLVSCYATLLRLQLALGDASGLRQVGRAGLQLMQNLNPIAIDPNTSYRLTRNSFRVLSIAALDGFDQGDKSLLMQVIAAMEAQHHHIHQPCFDQQAAQENHRRFASLMLEAVRVLASARADELDHQAGGAVRRLLVLVNSSERDLESTERFSGALERSMRQFAPFWSTLSPDLLCR